MSTFIGKFEKILTETNKFKEITKLSILYATPIKKMFQIALPNEKLLNFTFTRTYNDLSRQIITLKPSLALKFYRHNLHINDPMFDRRHINALYSRYQFMTLQQKNDFKQLTKQYQPAVPIVLEYDLDICKDAFCFLLANPQHKNFLTDAWFTTLMQAVIAFYTLYRPPFHSVLPPYETQSHTQTKLAEDPFANLAQQHGLTPVQGQYLKYLALSWETKLIATHLCKSERTVEKVIDAIKTKLKLSSKQELSMLLQCFYINTTTNHT